MYNQVDKLAELQEADKLLDTMPETWDSIQLGIRIQYQNNKEVI